MNKQSIKCIATSLAILGCISTIPQRAMADTFSSFSNIQISNTTLSVYDRDDGTGIFDNENLQYLSPEQQKQLKEYQEYKDTGKKLSEEQEKNLQTIVDCVTKAKLGDEKYQDFKVLAEKKKNGIKLTEPESKKLKEYRKTMHNCDDCSNSEILKQFLR